MKTKSTNASANCVLNDRLTQPSAASKRLADRSEVEAAKSRTAAPGGRRRSLAIPIERKAVRTPVSTIRDFSAVLKNDAEKSAIVKVQAYARGIVARGVFTRLQEQQFRRAHALLLINKFMRGYISARRAKKQLMGGGNAEAVAASDEELGSPRASEEGTSSPPGKPLLKDQSVYRVSEGPSKLPGGEQTQFRDQ